MIYDKVIKGVSVYFKSAQMDDVDFTYAIRQDRERTKYMHAVSQNIDDQRDWLKKQMEKPGDYFFVVYDNQDNKIGTCAVYNVDIDKKRAEIGRNLLNGNPTQNMEALIMIYEFGFYELGLEDMYADIAMGNNAAIGVTQRMGGKEIDRKYHEDVKLEMILFEISKADYEKKRVGLKQLIERFARRM